MHTRARARTLHSYNDSSSLQGKLAAESANIRVYIELSETAVYIALFLLSCSSSFYNLRHVSLCRRLLAASDHCVASYGYQMSGRFLRLAGLCLYSQYSLKR